MYMKKSSIFSQIADGIERSPVGNLVSRVLLDALERRPNRAVQHGSMGRAHAQGSLGGLLKSSKGPLNRVTLSELQMGAILDRACPELSLRKAALEHQQDKLTDRDRSDKGLHMADHTALTNYSITLVY